MHLTHPAALLLLALLGLLIFARLRRPPVRRRVSYLPFWREAALADSPAPARTLRRDPLLLVQMAILAAIVLALAGPHAGIGGRHVAIVLDVSMSMGARHDGGTRLERARAEAIELARTLPWATTVDVVAAGATPEDLGRIESADALAGVLAATATTAGSADLEAAVERVTRANPRPDRIYVFTDVPRPPGAGDSPPIEWTTIARPLDNASISLLSARRSVVDPLDLQMLVGISNHGSAPARAEVVLGAEDGEVWREGVEIPAHGTVMLSRAVTPRTVMLSRTVTPSRTVTLSRTVAHPGHLFTARLVRDDDLAADNVRSLVVPPARSRRVAMTGTNRFEETGAIQAVRAALLSHPGLAPVEGPALQEPSLSPDIVVCNGCSEVPPGDAGVLLIAPGRAGPADPVPLAPVGRGFLADLGLDGELVAPVSLPGDVEERSVVAHAAGVPAIVAREVGVRRIVELRFDPGSSPLSMSPSFPVLIDAALEWLAVDSRNGLSLVAGEPLQWVVPSPEATIAITGPGDRAVPFTLASGRLSASPSEAGLYRVRIGDREHGFAVNPAPSESVAPAAPSPMSTPAVAAGARPLRRDVSGALAALALLLLAVEWRMRGRRVAA